jgi:hypothetical protein
VRSRLSNIALIAIVALGVALRIWSARGGLWVDEAWSAVLAERARTPLGVFVAINHDNNHHINSLWMQLCGFGAPPLLLRGLSIMSGSLTIMVGAAIGNRQGLPHALIAALLFAISPILVNYGSEARGYAPMLLAATTMIWCITRALDDPTAVSRRSAWLLAGLALFGLFSQFTMLFFLVAVAGWVIWTFAHRMPIDAAFAATGHLLLPTFGACLLAIVTVLGAAALSPTGMQVGDYVPFAFVDWAGAVLTVASATLGLPAGSQWVAMLLIAVIAALALRAIGRRTPTGPFQTIAIIGFPLVFPLLQIGNSGAARYYMLATVAILLLTVDVLATAFAGRRTRIAATITLGVLTAACLREDIVQAALLRGDPSAAIEAMEQRSPKGAVVMVDHIRPIATLRVAAFAAHYPLAIVSGCPAQRYLHVDPDRGVTPPPTIVRCGRRYGRVIVRHGAMLSGVDWALYEMIGAGT